MILKPLYENSQANRAVPFALRALYENDFTGVNISADVKEKAILGSEFFKKRYDEGRLFPKLECAFSEIDMDEDLTVHNYTGQCPVQTFELNPVKGCNVGCAYCLANDGVHEDVVVVYKNYHEFALKKLEEQRHEEHYYYYSPKTEAFCEATLQTGIAHKILWAFIEHFERFPDSKARLFIASKSGAAALRYKYGGDSIIDLFKKLHGKMQFNTSLSIFPDGAIGHIEPYACGLTDRLEAVRLCRENGVAAESALIQPILINILSDELLDEFFVLLSRYGIVNIKPEFLTACVENMALMAQMLESFKKDIFKEIFEIWFREDNLGHIKQRGRTAPPRELSVYWIKKMQIAAERYGISTSICFWVREQLGVGEDDIPIINRNGYKCLGYQTRLF